MKLDDFPNVRPERAQYLAQSKRHKNFMAAPPWV